MATWKNCSPEDIHLIKFGVCKPIGDRLIVYRDTSVGLGVEQELLRNIREAEQLKIEGKYDAKAFYTEILLRRIINKSFDSSLNEYGYPGHWDKKPRKKVERIAGVCGRDSKKKFMEKLIIQRQCSRFRYERHHFSKKDTPYQQGFLTFTIPDYGYCLYANYFYKAYISPLIVKLQRMCPDDLISGIIERQLNRYKDGTVKPSGGQLHVHLIVNGFYNIEELCQWHIARLQELSWVQPNGRTWNTRPYKKIYRKDTQGKKRWNGRYRYMTRKEIQRFADPDWDFEEKGDRRLDLPKVGKILADGKHQKYMQKYVQKNNDPDEKFNRRRWFTNASLGKGERPLDLKTLPEEEQNKWKKKASSIPTINLHYWDKEKILKNWNDSKMEARILWTEIGANKMNYPIVWEMRLKNPIWKPGVDLFNREAEITRYGGGYDIIPYLHPVTQDKIWEHYKKLFPRYWKRYIESKGRHPKKRIEENIYTNFRDTG